MSEQPKTWRQAIEANTDAAVEDIARYKADMMDLAATVATARLWLCRAILASRLPDLFDRLERLFKRGEPAE